MLGAGAAGAGSDDSESADYTSLILAICIPWSLALLLLCGAITACCWWRRRRRQRAVRVCADKHAARRGVRSDPKTPTSDGGATDHGESLGAEHVFDIAAPEDQPTAQLW